jgi:Tripartite tricarboxylate transporter family receptor
VLAADVTPERLLNPDKEPQNWLMNHRSYDGQRFSPLDKINKGNVKGLKLAYAVALGGGAGNEFTNATPLAEDGSLYITDSWNVLYKIDATSGDAGRTVWRMDPKQDRQMRSRGAALSGNLVITAVKVTSGVLPPSAWFGVGAPKDTPNRRQAEQGDQCGPRRCQCEGELSDLGVTVLVGSPAEFGKFIADETEKWGKVVKFAGIKAE